LQRTLHQLKDSGHRCTGTLALCTGCRIRHRHTQASKQATLVQIFHILFFTLLRMWNTPALGLNLSLPAISVRVSMRQRHVIFSVRFIYPSVSYTALKWRFVLPEGARF